MLQPIWAMIKPFGFAVLWIWHPSDVVARTQVVLVIGCSTSDLDT